MALFVYATACALHTNRHRTRWFLLSVLVFALMLVTGTRLTLVLAIAPIVVVLSARRLMSGRFIRLALGGPIAVVLMLGPNSARRRCRQELKTGKGEAYGQQ